MKTLYRTTLIAAAVSGMLTAPAFAQQNPLTGLFGSIQAIGNSLHALATPAAPSASQTPTDPQPQAQTLDDGSPAFGALRTYALAYHQLTHDSGTSEIVEAGAGMTLVSGFSACANTPAAYRDARRSEQLLGQNTASAIGQLHTDAETIAACASDANNPPSQSPSDTLVIPRPRIPLEKAYSDVGQLLATAVLAQQAAGVVDGQTAADAKNAMVLLKTNAAANQAMIAKLAATGLVPELATKSGSHAIEMTAQQAVAAYKSNTFGFNSRYSGKELQITGPIENISGSGQSASVELQGYMPKNPQDQGFQDMVICQVGDPGQLQRVADLSKGQTVTLHGLYNPNAQYMKVGITLLNCAVN
jgi:hypothetical protein